MHNFPRHTTSSSPEIDISRSNPPLAALQSSCPMTYAQTSMQKAAKMCPSLFFSRPAATSCSTQTQATAALLVAAWQGARNLGQTVDSKAFTDMLNPHNLAAAQSDVYIWSGYRPATTCSHLAHINPHQPHNRALMPLTSRSQSAHPATIAWAWVTAAVQTVWGITRMHTQQRPAITRPAALSSVS